jgi:hypothetical protein
MLRRGHRRFGGGSMTTISADADAHDPLPQMGCDHRLVPIRRYVRLFEVGVSVRSASKRTLFVRPRPCHAPLRCRAVICPCRTWQAAPSSHFFGNDLACAEKCGRCGYVPLMFFMLVECADVPGTEPSCPAALRSRAWSRSGRRARRALPSLRTRHAKFTG